MALYRSILKRFAPDAKPTDVYHWYGMTVAWTMVDTLRRPGRTSPGQAFCARPGASTRPRTRSSARHAAARPAGMRSRSTPSTCTATTTGNGSAPRAVRLAMTRRK